jgi:hypothetical protein
MSDREAAERAAAILDDEAGLGRLLYGDGGAHSCYQRTEGDGFWTVLTTILPDGGHLVYRIGGVDFDQAFPPMPDEAGA